MRIESAIAAAIATCLFLTFYFSLLPYQTLDEAAKVQFLTLSTLFLAAGIILFFCLIFYHSIKRALSNNKLRLSRTKAETLKLHNLFKGLQR
ncbi:MAG: hypothetical protein RMJ15_00515 [Nitrososphaerota archaeon]|nr:hypothetical protein [Candidatus Bathyarchaeota archaeon]MDW8022217.1 hypothetical protein [Nitrososphaerota archaeon]